MLEERSRTPAPPLLGRVLVVDDSRYVLEMFIEALQDIARVRTLESGDSFIEQVRDFRPSLIILDINLPKTSGFELAKQLKDEPEIGNIPVVFITGESESTWEQTALDLGAIDFLQKPIRLHVVQAKVRNLLRLGDTEAQLNQANQTIRKMLSHLPTAVAVKDDHGRVLLVNTLYQDWFSDKDNNAEAVKTHIEADKAALTNSAKGVSRIETWWVDNKPLYLQVERSVYNESSGPKLFISATDISQHIKTEQKLSASESKFRDIYDKSPVMMHSIDAQGHIIHVSDYWLKKMGYERKEVLGRHSTDFLTPPSRKKAKEKVLPAFFETGMCQNISYQFITKSGRIMDVVLSASGVFDQQGQIQYSYAVLFDVTDKKQIEREYERQRKELQLIFDNVPANIWLKDGNNNVLNLNAAAARSINSTVEDTIGKSTRDIFPDVADQYYESDLRVLRSGQPMLNIVEKHKPSNALETWVRTDKVPFHDPISHDPYVLVISSDISALKHAQQAKEISEERFKLAMRGSSVGIWDWPKVAHHEEYWSPRFYQLIGYGDQEIPASIDMFRTLLHPDDMQRAMHMITQHLETKQPFELEYRLHHKTKGYRWFLGKGQASWNSEGKPLRMVGTIMDIHEHKLAQEKIQQQQKLLSHASSTLENIVSNTLKGLQGPLQQIGSLVKTASEAGVDNSAIAQAQEGTEQIQNVVDALSTFAAVKGPDQLDIQPLTLEQAFAAIAKRKGDNSLPAINIEQNDAICADPNQFTQVLDIIVDNAIKFRNPQHPLAIIADSKRSGDSTVIRIQDNGIGFDNAHREQVFELFQRLNPETAYPGNGMGLAIAKKIVKTHRGNISANSHAGRGTCITITLPSLSH